ncbi:MAG: hypothetical protein P8X98_01410 [Woeseiaceae bacterium]
MQRLKRVFAIDTETCPDCGGTLRVTRIDAPLLIGKIRGMFGNARSSMTHWRGRHPATRDSRLIGKAVNGSWRRLSGQ